jgi:small subunit ribosomal protein S19e
MATAQDVPASELIKRTAKELEINGQFKAPEWAKFAKTGTHKERPPMDKNWWYTRTAAVFRTVYLQGPVGTNTLRSKFGGKKNMGYAPDRFKKGSGSVARKSLQQLEKAGFIKQTQKGVHKGRVVTPAGKKFLDKVATQITNDSKKVSA